MIPELKEVRYAIAKMEQLLCKNFMENFIEWKSAESWRTFGHIFYATVKCVLNTDNKKIRFFSVLFRKWVKNYKLNHPIWYFTNDISFHFSWWRRYSKIELIDRKDHCINYENDIFDIIFIPRGENVSIFSLKKFVSEFLYFGNFFFCNKYTYRY